MAKHNHNSTQGTQGNAQAAQATQPATGVAAPQAAAATGAAAAPANPVAAALAAALANHAQAVAAPKAPYLAVSSVQRPVQLVHSVCAAVLAVQPSTTRGQLVAMCVQQGVATATAQTQVSQYLKAQRAKVAAQAAQ